METAFYCAGLRIWERIQAISVNQTHINSRTRYQLSELSVWDSPSVRSTSVSVSNSVYLGFYPRHEHRHISPQNEGGFTELKTARRHEVAQGARLSKLVRLQTAIVSSVSLWLTGHPTKIRPDAVPRLPASWAWARNYLFKGLTISHDHSAHRADFIQFKKPTRKWLSLPRPLIAWTLVRTVSLG